MNKIGTTWLFGVFFAALMALAVGCGGDSGANGCSDGFTDDTSYNCSSTPEPAAVSSGSIHDPVPTVEVGYYFIDGFDEAGINVRLYDRPCFYEVFYVSLDLGEYDIFGVPIPIEIEEPLQSLCENPPCECGMGLAEDGTELYGNTFALEDPSALRFVFYTSPDEQANEVAREAARNGESMAFALYQAGLTGDLPVYATSVIDVAYDPYGQSGFVTDIEREVPSWNIIDSGVQYRLNNYDGSRMRSFPVHSLPSQQRN